MGIFGFKVKNTKTSDFVQIIEGFSSNFAAFGAEKMNSDVWASAVNASANYRSKLRLVHRRGGREQNWFRQILQLRPNPIMNVTTFLESLSLDYDTYNNAFIYIDRDGFDGPLRGLWRISPSHLVIGAGASGELLCRFSLQGEQYTVPFDRICHIGRTITKDEIFGDDNSAINKILGIINTNYQGIEAAIKTSGLLRYVVKAGTLASKAQLRKMEREFVRDVLEPIGKGGVRFIDSAQDIQELKAATQKFSDFNEQKQYASQVYNFLGISEKIINGTNSDNEMISYYGRSIESFASKLAEELTYKIFTQHQIWHGNEIVAQANRLAYMSPRHRLEIARIVRELDIVSKGEFADLLFLPIDENRRDERMPLSQNYDDDAEYKLVYTPKKKKEGDGDGEDESNDTQTQ